MADPFSRLLFAPFAPAFSRPLENLRTVLAAAGSNVDSLLHLRIYVRGELEDHMESLVPILASFLGSSHPAVTGIGVASLASKATLVEVEAVAKADSIVSPRVVA